MFRGLSLKQKIFGCIDVFSEARTLTYGFPQSSVVGPLLFLLYENDLPQSLTDAGSHLYADENK